MKQDQIKTILIQVFSSKHIEIVLKRFLEGIKKYEEGDWEGVALKAGKFVESVTKSLLLYCKRDLPNARSFKAGQLLRSLESQDHKYNEVVRIVIPKCCLFIYEIVNNRGGRHDVDGFNVNQMDSGVVVSSMSWVLAEMVRFSSEGKKPEEAKSLIESLTKKVYPFFENIDGRAYINLSNLSAPDIALLLLYYQYPKRISRQELINIVVRHGHTENAAQVAVYRLKKFVDDDRGNWQLRGLGRQKAEQILTQYEYKK